jgi:carboxymethylenebutenolidase
VAFRTLQISESNGKSFTGYLSIPPSGKGPGLLLLQEVYGVNADIKAAADYYAAAGYAVLAPDLLWRQAPNLEFAYADRDQAAETLRNLGGIDPILPDLPVAAEALRHVPEFDGTRLGVLGFGFGGVLAYLAVGRKLLQVDAGVAFFPGRVDLSLAPQLTQPWLFHFGEHDSVAQPRGIDRLTADAFAARKDVAVYTYEGVLHGFSIPGRKEYDALAARQATVRTLDFLSRAIGWRAAAA